LARWIREPRPRLSSFEQSRSAFALHNPFRYPAATGILLLPLRTSNARENAMHVPLVFNIIFALSAFPYNRWSKVAAPRDLCSHCKPNSLLQSPGRDNKHGANDLHMRYADLSASGLGTAQQRITFRSKTQQNLVGFQSENCSHQIDRMAFNLGISTVPSSLNHAARPMSPETSTQEKSL
jgi:hypothetical protein